MCSCTAVVMSNSGVGLALFYYRCSVRKIVMNAVSYFLWWFQKVYVFKTKIC
jgi:hypothetical protein